MINSLAIDAIESGASTSTTKQSRDGSRSSMPRRHSHDGGHAASAIAGAVAALCGRTPVLLDQAGTPAFYAVPPLVMLRHCLPEASSLRATDLHLSSDQEIRSGQHVRYRAGYRAPNDLRQCRAIIAPASSPRGQRSTARTAALVHTEPAPILRSQLLGWRITCPLCGNQLRDAGGANSPPLSGNIAVRLFVAKSCSTMKPNVVSEPGLRQPKSHGFS
jgi:hypothetical protein